MTDLFLIILGLAGLWFGTELVIKGALNIADFLNLSEVFVGIAILAIGTDLPEIVVAIDASIESAAFNIDTSGIIAGNAIGSAFGQISLVLGVAGLMGYLTMNRKQLYGDGALLLGSVLMFLLLSLDGKLGRIDGIILITMYVVYYFTLFQRETLKEKVHKKKNSNIYKDILMLVVGMAMVIFASGVVVDHSVLFAEKLGIRQSFVGIIMIGVGTSLPELALTINAMRKKAHGLSVGNLVGSNIFDMLIPVGIGSTIAPVHVEKSLLWFDLPFLFVVSFLVLFFFHKKKGLQKIESVILIFAFVLYASLKLAGV